MASTDAALGFQRSSAPPLDASVGQFVPQQILSRYQETAEVSGTAGVQPGGTRFMAENGGPTSAAVASAVPSGRTKRGVGGPEQMSGAVVANFESIDPAGAAPNTPSVSANPAGFPASSVVYFPHDTTILNTGAKDQIRTAVQAYLTNGGQGYIRVVGHASSGGNVSMQRRMIWNFERSQARAKAVAQELIRDGIPANKVLVEAVGDSEPTYDPSQGEEGNRRAEIFFQT
jgi:outer membrane protein OmpA-like peptidoglycan-associated protein